MSNQSIDKAQLKLSQIQAMVNLLLLADGSNAFEVEHSEIISNLWTIFELAELCSKTLQGGSDHE